MRVQEGATTVFEPCVFRTRNVSASENQAHTREGAQAMGFRGSIVAGAIVYGQMIQPLVRRYGTAWLGRNWCNVRFKAPAYEDDLVTSTVTPDAQSGESPAFVIRATNQEGQELVEMHTSMPDVLPPPDPLATLEPCERHGERVPGTWERMVLNRPFCSFYWCLTLAEQITYCERTEEELALYREGDTPPVHPALVMSQGSLAIQNQFVMPFWIHASSMVLTRDLIRIGDVVELRCVPIEKWKRGENEWVKFYQVYRVNNHPVVEAWKTSIIKVATRG